jgi:hypothetical protein
MAITTYATLLTAVENWLARSDTALTDRIPEFITLFEAKMNRELRCNQMETRAYTSVNMAASEPEFITLPGDMQTMRRVRLSSVTGKPRLQFLSGNQADEYRYGSAYTLEMVYRANIPGLDADNTQNWLLTLAPDLYLYGVLMEASAYTSQDERIPVWFQAYQYALNGLNKLGQDQAYNAGPAAVVVPGYNP